MTPAEVMEMAKSIAAEIEERLAGDTDVSDRRCALAFICGWLEGALKAEF